MGSRLMKRLWQAAAALTTLAVTQLALACPVCGQREEPGSSQWFALGALVVLPWFVVAGVAYWMRRSMLQLDGSLAVTSATGLALDEVGARSHKNDETLGLRAETETER